MKRLFIAIILLFIVAGLCTFEFTLNTKESQHASEYLKTAQQQMVDGNEKEAIQTMKKLKELWESNVESMLIFISHEKPDEICENIAVAESYLKSGEHPEFYAECKRIENELEHFRDLEIPTINNIL